MKEKELILPDDWEVKEVIGNKIIISEKEKELPKTWEKCAIIINDVELINIDSEVEGYAVSDFDEGSIDAERRILPVGMGKPMLALCQLLICRNAWWKQLGWKPDWESPDSKFCITCEKGNIERANYCPSNEILAFPSVEIMDQFLSAFRNLIEEAKELL